ncbi:MAG TPA: sugar transferase [Ruminococcaceae bacterium]|nr:sugar transferase [Oscillospiraceae bacterium]
MSAFNKEYEKEFPMAVRNNSAVAVRESTAEKTDLKQYTDSNVILKKKPIYNAVKRFLDIACAVLGFIAASPLFLVFSVMIKMERSGKNVFYKQKRLGKNGKEIYIYKFRSMVDDADNLERWLNKEQIRQYHTEYKVENDPRTTRFGSFLRRTGLDEMPQLLNILKGELSLVGPRPIQEEELKYYGENKDLLLSVKPGLTGYWQAYCSDDTTYSNKKRQKMELEYVKNCNLWWDIKICFATAGAIIRKAQRGQ